MKCLFLLPLFICLSSLRAQSPGEAQTAVPTARVVFAQYCFWTGEMKLGQIDGVLRTEAGFFQGHEVTQVDYDPSRISLEQLARQAKQAAVADRLYLPSGAHAAKDQISGVPFGGILDRSYRKAPASDQKKQIAGTPYASLKLTPEQATKVNAFVRVEPSRAQAALTSAQRAQSNLTP